MALIQLLSAGAKVSRVYQRFCLPVCRQYQLNQTALDIVMFLANNPDYNTARDICNRRGIKSGMVSVTVESLIRSGYLTRESDSADRRIQRLVLSEQASVLIRDGRAAQNAFGTALSANFTQHELETYLTLTQKLIDTINELDGGIKSDDPVIEKDEAAGMADGAAVRGARSRSNLF